MQFTATLVSSIASLTNYGVATELVSCCENGLTNYGVATELLSCCENDGTVAGYVNRGLLTISCSGMAFGMTGHFPLGQYPLV